MAKALGETESDQGRRKGHKGRLRFAVALQEFARLCPRLAPIALYFRPLLLNTLLYLFDVKASRDDVAELQASYALGQPLKALVSLK